MRLGILTIFYFYSLIAHSQINTKKEFEIYSFLQLHYNKCLSSGNISNENEYLISALDVAINDTLSIPHIKKSIDKHIESESWNSIKPSLIELNNTYWKPIVNNDIECKFELDKDLIDPSITKPIFYDSDNWAIVISYHLVSSLEQNLIILNFVNGKWTIIDEIRCGIYLEYGQ